MKIEFNKLYSTDDETFDKRGLDEVIDDLECDYTYDEMIGMEYYSADYKPVDLSKYLNASSILDDADDYLYDNIRIEDRVFDEVSKEAVIELDILLKLWLDKHFSNHGLYEIVGKSTTYIITKDDLEGRYE